MNGQEPAITQQDPRAYYLWLQTQRVPPVQAVQMVQQRFGTPKTPEEQARQQANQAQSNALAQTGGTIGGLLIGQQALQGFPALSGLFGTTAPATPTLIGATKVGAGAAGTAGTTVATPTVVGATKVGAGTAGTAGTTAGSSGLGSAGSVALPVAAVALGINNLWETGMKDILRGRGTREDYINQAVNFAPIFGVPGTGGAINLGLRLMGKRSVGKMMTTGKSDAQLLRDDFRGLLKETAVADNQYNVTLADGSKFNIGLDGKTKYQNVGENIDGKKTRHAWDVDFSNPLAQYAVNQIDPMIRNIYKETDGKVKPEQYTGMLVNAVTSNAKSNEDVLANIQAMLGKSTFAQQAGVAVPTPQKPGTPVNVQQAKTPQVSTPETKKLSLKETLNKYANKK